MNEHKEVKTWKHRMTDNMNESLNSIELWMTNFPKLPDAN